MSKDDGRLEDIVRYAQAALDIVQEGDPVSDLRDRLALERALFIVGEAAAQISPDVRRSIDQPWSDIVGMRNVLAHRYDAVEIPQLVLIAERNLPGLVLAVEAHLASTRRSP